MIFPIQMDLIYELNRIGNNLNQIAKSMHTMDNKHKITVLAQLVEIEKQLQKLQYKQEM